AKVHPIVHFVALAPPEEALRVVEDSGAIAELDQLKEIVDVGAAEKNGVGEIHDERTRRVVGDDHVAAEERRATRGVEEAGSARTGEAEDSGDNVRWSGGNVSDDGALA